MDITDLILADHERQRRAFAVLDELDRDNSGQLAAVWGELAAFLETHAAAEEALFYPALLHVGAEGDEETTDAVSDHNDIRDAVARAGEHPVGGEGWWRAVADARVANSDHMGEEERGALADFRRRASLQQRHELGVRFAAFEAAHPSGRGITPTDSDPQQYVAEHSG